jgi:ribosome-associated translation inhibitor RaiA/DNA-directed RNA polymerase specialized sigma24 family protein
MRKTQDARHVHTNLDTKNCSLRRSEIEAMEASLGTLESVASSFPFADLYVTVSYSARSEEYHVKTSLKLPGRILFTGEHDSVALPAYERCIRKLVRKVEDYKNKMETRHGARGRLASGTQQTVDPDTLPELEQLENAFQSQDYDAFRTELSGFEEPIRRRLGRWIQRYPELDKTFGEFLPMDDLVEEVILTAFERYESRPTVMRLGDWLESMIDPAMRSFLRHPDEELEAISFAKTLHEMNRAPAANAAAGTDQGDEGNGVQRKPR